jgi:diguanylate cyclase (GGDEF)-like protein
MGIGSDREVWQFTLSVTLITTIASQALLIAVFLLWGNAAFEFPRVLLLGALLPLLLAAPVSWVLATRQRELADTHARFAKLALTDPLTGLPNRRAFFSHATEALTGMRLNGRHGALLVIDADRFKDLNDAHGHSIGDAALCHIGGILGECLRKTDLACRLGGEEFAVFLPGVTAADAASMAHRIVAAVAERPMLADALIIRVSVSCGYADTTVSYDLQRLYKAADDAMYGAKAAGRNRALEFSKLAAAR